MGFRLKSVALAALMMTFFAFSILGQNTTESLKEKVDALIVTAYQSASAQFPCKIKTGGKPKMIRWQDVEDCLNGAEASVDWENLLQQVQKLRQDGGFSKTDMSLAIESALAAQAMSYQRVFSVKEMDVLLPLSNTLLKFLPADSLQGLPVFAKSGERIGTFAGAYSFEKAGGLNAGNYYRMSMFQYTDLRGSIQSPAIIGRLLLDSFGVPWKDAVTQPGFRLTADKLTPKR